MHGKWMYLYIMYGHKTYMYIFVPNLDLLGNVTKRIILKITCVDSVGVIIL